MTNLFEAALINAAVVSVLAVAVWLMTRRWRHPALVHTLWVILLVKLVTPPMVTIPWRFGTATPSTLASSIDGNSATNVHRTGLVDRRDAQRDERTGLRPVIDVENPLPVPHPGPGEGFDASVDFLPNPVVSEEQTSAARSQATVDSQTAFAPAVSWKASAMSAWLLGSAMFLFISALRMLRFHRALASTQPVPKVIYASAAELAARFGLTGRYRLRLTEGRLPPLVWPVGQPTIVLPRHLVNELSRDELQTLLAHELAHLRRHDHWVRWLELVVTALYWWHPVVWWARTAIQQAEEEACDAWVVSALPHSVAHYASALFKAAQFVSERRPPEPILASALGSGGKLKERIEHIMNTTWKPRLLLPVRLTVLLLALLILPLSLRMVGATGEPGTSQGPQVETSDEATAESLAATASGPAADAEAAPGANQSAVQSDDAARTEVTPVDAGDPANQASNSEQAQKIRVGTTLTIRIFPSVPDNPIGDVSRVDLQGRVALGPLFGRVKLEGKTVDEAEAAIIQHLESLEVIREPRVQVTFIGNSSESRPVLSQRDPYHIKAGDIIAVMVSNGAPDAPIDGDFMVEPSGAVPLGPLYGRVKIAGLTFEDAEKAVVAHLQRQLKDPKVQITIGGWRGRPTSSVPPTSRSPGSPFDREGEAHAAGRSKSTPTDLDTYHPSIDIDPFAQAAPPGQLAQYLADAQQRQGPANPAALEAMREYVQFLEDHFKKVEALNRNGLAGGDAHSLALAGYELALAQGELALAEGNHADARTHFAEAEKQAEQALVAFQAAHRAGMVTDDALLEAAKSLSYIKRRNSAVRDSATATESVPSDATTRRDSAPQERTQLISTSSGTESLGVLKKIAERAKLDYERVQELAEQKAVSATELARAKSDYEIAVERLRQAERGLRYYQLLLESAEADYQMLLETNKRAPNTVTKPALRKAKLAVELAKAKLEELSE